MKITYRFCRKGELIELEKEYYEQLISDLEFLQVDFSLLVERRYRNDEVFILYTISRSC